MQGGVGDEGGCKTSDVDRTNCEGGKRYWQTGGREAVPQQRDQRTLVMMLRCCPHSGVAFIQCHCRHITDPMIQWKCRAGGVTNARDEK